MVLSTKKLVVFWYWGFFVKYEIMTKYIYPKFSFADNIQAKIAAVLESLGENIEPEDIHLEHPNDETHGDYATNIALTLTKKLGKNPREIAVQLKTKLEKNNFDLGTIEIAGPGFINFRLDDELLKTEITKVNHEKDYYGRSDIHSGETAMVEFGQPNTHKAIHIGHIKSGVSGLAMAGLFNALGYDVIKANYFGDIGLHVAKCLWGYIQKGEPKEIKSMDAHQKMAYLDVCYVYGSEQFKEDENAALEIKTINKKIYSKEDSEINKLYDLTREWSRDHQFLVFQELGIEYDVEFPESTVADKAIEQIKNHIGDVFEKSKGAIIYNGEKEGLTTWVFLTSEGLPTYSGKDMGLALRKFNEFAIDLGVVTTSVEQTDYFKVVIRALEKIQPETTGKYKHIPFGWMLVNNKKFSSRQGTAIKGIELIEDVKEISKKLISSEKDYSEVELKEISNTVAIAALKFMILSHEFHKNMSYDPEKFITLSGYSGPYLLYTYARCNSIVEKADIEDDEDSFYGVLNSPEEISLLRHMQKYSDILLDAGQKIAPHLICTYLYELCQKFNKFYTEHSILSPNTEADYIARVKLTKATAQVLRNGLSVLGIDTVEKM